MWLGIGTESSISDLVDDHKIHSVGGKRLISAKVRQAMHRTSQRRQDSIRTVTPRLCYAVCAAAPCCA